MRNAIGRWGVAGVLALLLVPAPAAAVTFTVGGYAGDVSTPTQEVTAAAGPLSLDLPNILPGTRSAVANGFVDHGIARVSGEVEVASGTQSIGDVVAVINAGWQDTITFAAPGEIPGLPGVSIIEGVTPGTAELVVFVDGSLSGFAGSNGYFRSSYGAGLSYGPFGGSGFASIDGTLDAFSFDGTPLPAVVTLPVSFVYGEGFDVQFQFGAGASVGYEGLANGDFLASALLDQSALWGGVQNVQAEVPDGGGGTMSVPLPAGFWSAASPSFDYSEPVAAPEPGALSLLLAGLALLAARARSRPLQRDYAGVS